MLPVIIHEDDEECTEETKPHEPDVADDEVYTDARLSVFVGSNQLATKGNRAAALSM